MPNPILNADQRQKANELLERIRAELVALAGDDSDLLFAYRRRVAKMLVYDERGGPNKRGRLKRAKMIAQGGRCLECSKPLPSSDNVLDRFSAVGGYTDANTRLICELCDRSIQRERGYR